MNVVTFNVSSRIYSNGYYVIYAVTPFYAKNRTNKNNDLMFNVLMYRTHHARHISFRSLFA